MSKTYWNVINLIIHNDLIVLIRLGGFKEEIDNVKS